MVRLRSTIERLMAEKSGVTVATRFRVRVLAGKKFGPWTKKKRSPVIQPSGAGSGGGADADCDGDGSPNGADGDDDNDLLSDTVETQIKTDVCVADTDSDGLEDGFEYQSALDLNDDEDQEREHLAALPGQAALPEPARSLGHRQGLRRRLPRPRRGALALEVRPRAAVSQPARSRRCTTPMASSTRSSARGSDAAPAPDAARRRLRAAASTSTNWAGANGYRTVMLDNGPPWYAHETPPAPTACSTSTATAPSPRPSSSTTTATTATCPTTSATRTPTASATTTRPTGA